MLADAGPRGSTVRFCACGLWPLEVTPRHGLLLPPRPGLRPSVPWMFSPAALASFRGTLSGCPRSLRVARLAPGWVRRACDVHVKTSDCTSLFHLPPSQQGSRNAWTVLLFPTRDDFILIDSETSLLVSPLTHSHIHGVRGSVFVNPLTYILLSRRRPN